jgi:hypothetical protein
LLTKIATHFYAPTSTTQKQLLTNAEAEAEQDNQINILPDGYNAANISNNNNEIDIDNPSTWPINSEEARAIRREFIAEGFRKLYATKGNISSRSLFHTENASGAEVEVHDSILAAAVEELGWRLGRRENEEDGSNELSLNEDNDWMYLPQ